MKNALYAVVVGMIAVGTACSAAPLDDAEATPEATLDGLDPEAAITVNGFTLDAQIPVKWIYCSGAVCVPKYSASMVISGGSGAQRMGVCLLQVAQNGSGQTIPCSTVNDCGAVGVPAGGFRYCSNPNNSGQKYCMVRPGSQSTYCAGSPANGGVPVGNGTYATPWQIQPTTHQYVSYACLNGCTTSDPSVSSATF
jgi:hypothetical protein